MTKKKLYILLAAVLACSLLAEALIGHFHSPAWWPLPFGYNIFFGFLGCWALIIIAKIIMSPVLQRGEDYYESRGGDDE